MNEKDFERRVHQALATPVVPGADFEARLFQAADDLLARRREALEARRLRWSRLTPAAHSEALSRQLGRMFKPAFELVARVHPIATTALVVLAFLGWNLLDVSRPRNLMASPDNKQDYPKMNDALAQYDAMCLAERVAYEKEVEDAHRESSGGI